MPELTASGAFEGLLAASPRSAPVWIEPAHLRVASVIARRDQAAAVTARAAAAFGAALPDGPRRVSGPRIAFIGSAPGVWLAVSDEGGPTLNDLRTTFDGLASVVDQGGGYGVLRIGGPRAADLLAAGVFLDLHPAAFPPGSAAATVLAHVGVILWRTRESFEILVPRSYAAAVAHWAETVLADPTLMAPA